MSKWAWARMIVVAARTDNLSYRDRCTSWSRLGRQVGIWAVTLDTICWIICLHGPSCCKAKSIITRNSLSELYKYSIHRTAGFLSSFKTYVRCNYVICSLDGKQRIWIPYTPRICAAIIYSLFLLPVFIRTQKVFQ